MRTLVFSDTHLGVSKSFDEKQYRFLEDLIKQSDHVIINGDFWEGYLLSFEQFKHSPYRHLFPLLKSKRTVYIPGNHDYEGVSAKGTSIFSDVKTRRYEMKLKQHTLVFEHGDLYAPLKMKDYIPDSIIPVIRIPVLHILNSIELLTMRKMNKITSLQFIQKKLNGEIKKHVKKTLKDNEIFICGHTHLAEFNLAEKFINSGMIKWGLGQYLIIEDDRVTPHEEWYA